MQIQQLQARHPGDVYASIPSYIRHFTIADLAPKEFEALLPEDYAVVKKNFRSYPIVSEMCQKSAVTYKSFVANRQAGRIFRGALSSYTPEDLRDLEKANHLEALGKKIMDTDKNIEKEVRRTIRMTKAEVNRLDHDMIKRIYKVVLDGSSEAFPEYDGSVPLPDAVWLLSLLQDFKREQDENPELANRLKGIIKELKNYVFLEAAKKVFSMSKKDWIINRMLKEIDTLQHPGDEVLFGGGYKPAIEQEKKEPEKIKAKESAKAETDKKEASSQEATKKRAHKGHAAQYLFRKDQEGHSLIFVNTGEGSEQDSFDEWMDELKRIFNETVQGHVHDVGWNYISKEDIHGELLLYLLSIGWDRWIPHTMQQVKEDVSVIFNQAHRRIGRRHWEQLKGSCILKSLMSWLHGRMAPVEQQNKDWREFKVSSTKLLLSKTHDLKGHFLTPERYERFEREVRKILAKREKKFEKA